jgi:HSP20 family protein
MANDDLPERYRRRRFGFPFGFPFRGYPNMDEFFREFERFYEEAFRDIEKQVPRDLVRERRLPDGRVTREVGPLIYGYSVTIGPDGKPVVREFGNVRTPGRGKLPVEVQEKREPLVDVLDEDKTVRVVAEVPGVTKDEIELRISGRTLSIAANAARKYFKSVELPAEIDPESAKATYKNGVLDVTLTKLQPSPPKGKPIRID